MASSSLQPGSKPDSLYGLLGGEAGVRQLVEIFYDVIEGHAEGHRLHLLHLRGHGVEHSRIEQFNFLSGFLGGPGLYREKFGHADVRRMHEHVEIDADARDDWLKCMGIAIDKAGFDAALKEKLLTSLKPVADRLVNRQ